MNPNNLLQMAWKFIAPRIPSAGDIMNKAMEVGQREGTPAAVMGMIEAWAKSTGKGGILEQNAIWNSFKQKTPTDIIPHGEKLLKESGKFDFLMNLIKGN